MLTVALCFFIIAAYLECLYGLFGKLRDSVRIVRALSFLHFQHPSAVFLGCYFAITRHAGKLLLVVGSVGEARTGIFSSEVLPKVFFRDQRLFRGTDDSHTPPFLPPKSISPTKSARISFFAPISSSLMPPLRYSAILLASILVIFLNSLLLNSKPFFESQFSRRYLQG